MRKFFSVLVRPAPVWMVAIAMGFGMMAVAGAAYPPLYAQIFAVNNVASAVPLTVKAFSGQSADLTDWQNSSGAVIDSVTAAGQGNFATLAAANFTASNPACTNGSGVLIAAGTCSIFTQSYNNSGAVITVKLVSGGCASGATCQCQTSPGTGEANCDSQQYYNLYPYQLCEARLAYAGPAAAAFGVIAYVGNNTATGAGNNGDHLLFYNGTGTSIAGSTDLSAYVSCKAVM